MNLKESVGIEVEKIDNTVTKGSSMYRERPVYKLVGVVENELSLGGKGCLENKCFNWYYWEYFQIDGESSFFFAMESLVLRNTTLKGNVWFLLTLTASIRERHINFRGGGLNKCIKRQITVIL